MNSQDKRHGSYRGSMQGYCRYSDGFSDASGFMDETDREVSNLTDRAFRSLCIGEEAVYNDSSPVERHKAFADDTQNDEVVKGEAREMFPRGAAEPYGEAAETSGIAPMFQRSVTDEDVAKQEHALAARTVSHHSNGVIETTWQQKRSSSKVSSLIRAFSAGYEENVAVTTDATVMSQDSLYKQDSESWEGSALLSIQKELSEFSSVYHQSIKGSSYPQTRNLFSSSEAAAAPQIPLNAESSAPSPNFMKSSSSKCSGKVKKPSSRNFFLHSEFSPFQTWKEYNRHLYDREALLDVPSTSQSPRWYDSPFYKELTVAHRNQMAELEEKRFHRKQYENPLPAEPPASTVRQKASAIEKRSESEVTLNCPPWRRSQEPLKNKFPQNRPCTASPVSDRSRRKEEGLVPTGRTSATNQKVQMVADDQTSNSGTPFSISQLLTPLIHPRQETETSEILQYALSPNILDPQLSSETDPRMTPEVKPRNKYKAMASSLLFNLKDNRKRVKSTYTPTMFKSLEIPDHSKQPSQLDSLIAKDGSVTSNTPLSWAGAPVRSNQMDLQSVSSPVAQNAKTYKVNYARRTEACRSDDYLTLISPQTVREDSSYGSFSHAPQESVSVKDKLADVQRGRHVDSLFVASNETPVRQRLDSSSWKAYELGGPQGQDINHMAPEVQRLPHSFSRTENDKDIKEKYFTKRDVSTSRAVECRSVEDARTREQLYDYKLGAEVNFIKNNINKEMFSFGEKGVIRTEKVPMIGDIAALLEKDRQLLEAQRGNAGKQDALVSGERYSNKKELFAHTEKGNAKQESLAMREKQCTQNELRKNEVFKIHPSDQVEVKRQNSYVPNEGINVRQEYRRVNHELYDAQGNYCDNLAANKGLYFTREMIYTSKQAVPVTRENKPVKNEFVVKEQVPHSASGVRYAPIEEFARKDRELEQQRLIAMVESKQEPVKVQALIKQYEGSIGENRNGLFTTGECKETRIGAVQETYMSNMLSVTVAEQGKEKLLHAPLDSTAISEISKYERGFNTQLSAPSEFERSDKHVQVSKQSKCIQNEVPLHKEQEVAPPREKGQTRQEILTSKLKAHAEKEIFAIKEKGHAKLEAHATKPKELYVHVNKEGAPLSTEHVKNNTVPLDGDRLANQDSAALKEARRRDGAFVDQGTSSSVERGKNVVIGDEENQLAKPAPTTREKEHARDYIITKTERISIRQEELQSIARAKIEAIAGNRIHQPKRANEESGSAHLTAPSNLSKNTENVMTAANVNVSQAEVGDAKKHEEKERVKMEGLPERQEQSQNLGTAVNEIHKAKNVLLNKEISSVSQVAVLSLEQATNQTGNEQAVGDILSRREREGEISDVQVNKEADFIRPTAERTEDKTAANHEKHKDATPVTIQKEHSSNYLLVSKGRVTLQQEVAPSIDHIANNETSLVRECIGAVEKYQGKKETAALHQNHQVKLGSLASRKSDGAENDAHGIQLRSTQEELSPVTNVKTEAVTENQRQESTREPEKDKRASVTHELPQLLEKENGVCETPAISETPLQSYLAKPAAAAARDGRSEDDKNGALAKEERSSLKQEGPLLVQHRNKTFAVQEKDEFKWAEKEHARTGVQGKDIGCFIPEEPSVEHIRIKIISHDKTNQVSESIIAIGNAKRETGALERNQQIKVDSLASKKSEHAEPDRHGNTEGLCVKQEVLIPIEHVKSDPISETLPAQQEPENLERDHIKLGISQCVEKEDIEKEANAVDGSYLASPGPVATREADYDKMEELAKKQRFDVADDEPPSVEHIRIKIISHNADQPVREKIVSIENKTVSLLENQPFKRDSLPSGKNEIPENDALGIPGRIRLKQEELPPITSTEKETSAVNQRHEETHERVNKDRGTELEDQIEKQIGTNETVFNTNPLAEPEAVAPRQRECDKSNEKRINDRQEVFPPAGHVTQEAGTAEEEGHGDKQGTSVTGQKEHVKSSAPVNKEHSSFIQDESVKHNRIQIIPVDESQQVRESVMAAEKEHSLDETLENLPVKLDSLACRKHDSAGNTVLESIERIIVSNEGCLLQTTNESNTVDRNPQLENALERMGRNGFMNQVPTSTEKESIKNETAEINEKRVLATRETKDPKADSLAKKERINLGQDVRLSLECLEKENIQTSENVELEMHDSEAKEQAKRDVNKDTDESVNTEKKSDGLEELSSAANVEVKASHKPKQELPRDSVRQELPQPREDEPLKKGSVAVSEKHKDKQEVLPTRKTELVENVHALNKTGSVKREEKERTSSFNENDHVAQGTLARRGEDSGSFAHVNAEDRFSSTPLNETIAHVESHQAKHGLAKRDRENVLHERALAGETENPENKTSAVAERRLARQEVKMTREGDATNEALMNKGRDGIKVHPLPLKDNEQAQNVRSVTDKIHQAVLADRSGSTDSDSPLKIKRVMDRDIAGGEGLRHKRDVLSTRERAHAQNEALLFDENLQFKLDALARRRKEKAEKYARANVDGTHTRRGEHASRPRAKTEPLTVDKTHLARHGLVTDDITRGISTGEIENIRTAASENPLTKMEASITSNKEYGKKDALVYSEAAAVRNRALVTRDREHGQNETPNVVNHRAKHLLESKPKASITRAPLPSENIRNESTSASENATKEAFAMSKREDARNCGVANRVGDGANSHQDEAGTDSVNHKAKRGIVDARVEKDSDRHGHTDAGRTEERRDIIPPGEKENDKRQVIEKERVRMEKGEWEVFPTKRSIVGKGELLNIAKGPTILDYLIEKDRDRSQHNTYAANEKDTIKQEVHATKDPTKKEVLVLEKKELIKKEGFACEGNTAVSNIEMKDREGAKNKEGGSKEMGGFLPEVLVRKNEVPTENTFAVRDKHQAKQVTDEAAEPTKQELFSRKYHRLSENIKEHAAHKALVTRDHPKQEAAATRSSSNPEMVLAKEREPIRKETFETKGKGQGAVDRLSTQHTDYIKATECADRGKTRVRQEVPAEQYRNLSKNIFIMQDKDLSKQSAAHVTIEKEHSKREIVLSRGDAKQELLAKQGNVYAKPQVFPTHEKVSTNPEVYAAGQAKYLSGKEACAQRQEHYSKHAMLVADGKDNSHGRNIIPRGNGKMESLPNTQNEMKETPPLREKEREIVAMREYRAQERAVARQKQQHYDPEAHVRQEYATYKTLKEKTDLRREVAAQFEKENAKKEVRANNLKDRTEMAAADHPKQNIEGQSIREPKGQCTAPSLPLQVNGWRGGGPVFSQQPGHINVPTRESYLTVGDASQSPEEEYKARPSSRSMQGQTAKGSEENNVVEEAKRDTGKPGDALQYYAIINHERKTEAGDGDAASSQRQERMPSEEDSGLAHGELNEGGRAQGLMDYTKAHTPTPHSNASSPALGKPVLFKVKDNTLRGSPVTKTVKPCFHKTLADDQRLSSSQENLSGVEKGDEQCDRLKENVDVPVPRSAPAVPPRASRSRELPGHHSVPAADFTAARVLQAHSIHCAPEFAAARQQPAHSVVSTPEFISVREPRSYYRRNRHLEEDGRRSAVSTMSEDLESCATSVTGVSAGMYAENPCERPESACSDMRALGKPPSVPPKSEKALRRAQRLSTRRIRKAETQVKAESLSQMEHKPLRAVASMPSSPTEVLLSRQAAPTYQPAPPQFCVEPGYAPHAPGLLAQPFPITQRRLLQDPNSGQYFVVDVPVQVKTKMFFDPETGKYVQLSVRESPEGTRSNAPSSVELLSPPPYVLYPGFLPMPVSSLPPLRSTSQMSAPAALMDDQDKRGDTWRQEAFRRKCNREAEPYIEPVHRSRDQPGEKPSYDVERGYTSPRNLNIIPMSELEDFALESA